MASKDAAGVFNNVQIVYSEMSEVDKNLVIEIATNSLKSQEKSERTIHHKDIAQMVKHELEAAKGGTWNVVVGSSFGSYVTHETKTIAQFLVGNIGFLIWRHG